MHRFEESDVFALLSPYVSLCALDGVSGLPGRVIELAAVLAPQKWLAGRLPTAEGHAKQTEELSKGGLGKALPPLTSPSVRDFGANTFSNREGRPGGPGRGKRVTELSCLRLLKGSYKGP